MVPIGAHRNDTTDDDDDDNDDNASTSRHEDDDNSDHNLPAVEPSHHSEGSATKTRYQQLQDMVEQQAAAGNQQRPTPKVVMAVGSHDTDEDSYDPDNPKPVVELSERSGVEASERSGVSASSSGPEKTRYQQLQEMVEKQACSQRPPQGFAAAAAASQDSDGEDSYDPDHPKPVEASERSGVSASSKSSGPEKTRYQQLQDMVEQKAASNNKPVANSCATAYDSDDDDDSYDPDNPTAVKAIPEQTREQQMQAMVSKQAAGTHRTPKMYQAAASDDTDDDSYDPTPLEG